MVLVALLGVAWSRYFSTGQVVAHKVRLVHGLDAAAYSGALVQARTLNFLSYLNRAQLGHQLAMAHLLTLGSWAYFGGMQADRLARGNPPAHLIGLEFGPAHGQAYRAAAAAAGLPLQAESQGSLGRAWIAHDAFIQGEFRHLSDALVRGLPEARMAAMTAVLAAHYPERPRGQLVPTVLDDGWPSLLRQHAPDAPLADLVRRLAGMYSFLEPRDGTARNPWPVDGRCPGLRHELRRRGATVLDASGHWQAGDTQSFHALRSNRWIGCYYREYAMGWAWMPAPSGGGPGDYAPDAPANFSGQDFWRWVRASTRWDLTGGRDNPLANSYAVAQEKRWASGGLAPYYDVMQGADGQAASAFTVQMWLPDDTGHTLRARGAAESYFARVLPRADGHEEKPNLFHPYWHARLARSQ